MSLKAIIFDFNGVISNDEPIHLRMFQKVLREEGIRLTAKEYYKHYLAFDDKNCFKKIFLKNRKSTPSSKIQELIERKAKYYEAYIENHRVIFTGAKKWILKFARLYPLAIASAARGHEIRWILKKEKLLKKFKIIVGAEDTKKSKPDPESYLLALKKLNRFKKILPSECLIIEDSIAGIEGAHRAGIKCLALAHTYTKKELQKADLVFKGYEEMNLKKILAMF